MALTGSGGSGSQLMPDNAYCCEPKIPSREQLIERATNDPWAHRSENMRCKTCMFFVLKSPSLTVGRCRRHAPTMSGYPVVFDSDWCGDHKLNEVKNG